ncbi:MAG: hypothetical protein KAQ94_09740 [Arcobacteraceae bacterium]|nr:hypothetical protein [Arcobacteraceae bacterium]
MYTIIYNINSITKDQQISNELQNSIKDLKLNYDITTYHNKKNADAIDYSFTKNKKLLKILSESLDANDKQKEVLRKKLYDMLYIRFNAMKSKGIKILLFAHPDNTTFLRMHKPDKYGDELSKIRYGITLVNKIKKPIHGFEQGKISHAFRNIYPLFDDNNRYLGCFDLSYSSDNMQNTLSAVNKMHSHFLVNKEVINAKIWKTKEIKSDYTSSIEHENYMVSQIKNPKYKDVVVSKEIIAKQQKYINENISNSKSFAIYQEYNNKAVILSFIPIKSIKNSNNATAYIVSYTYKKQILEILNIFMVRNTISFIILVIGLYLIYNQLIHKKELIIEVTKKTKELKELNENLEQKISIETEKNREKDKLIYDQAKNAQMGEMIGNIAHQWRQPLSVISTVSSGLSLKIEYKIFDEDEAKKDLDILHNSAQFLSKTIDTFRDFIKEEKKSKEVVLQNKINYAIDIISASLKINHIKLINNIDYSNPINITLVVGELSQVLINIFNNAKDVLVEKNIEDKWIKINIEVKEDLAVISIEDNGGGIPEEILPKIFNPYFTTKHQSQGTGLGLHMSQEIIRKNLNGKLYAKNSDNGAIFFIELPLS